MKKAYVLCFIILSALFIFGCTKKTEIANPASEFCEENGGILEIITNKDGGQIGICTLKDGTKCEDGLILEENVQILKYWS